MKKPALFMLLTLVLLAGGAAFAQDAVYYSGIAFRKNSQSINLGDMVLPMNDLMAFLDQFPNLRHVDMFGTKVNKEEIQLLTSRYPNVTFGWTIHIFGKGKGHDVRTDQTAFFTLHGDCYEHSTEQLEVLKYCTELRALDLGHNRIRDISFLKDMTKLRVLILACNEITDISVLENMPDLEYVELFTNKIEDITPLLKLPHLMDLNLTYNRVPGIEELSQMTQLKRLWVGHCVPNLEGKLLQTLVAALPDTQVIAEGDPTQNGWREHPHYDVNQAIFQSGIYSPYADSYPSD